METSDQGASIMSVNHSPSLLRYAAQPDVVLSQERDSYYAKNLLGEAAADLAETLLGSRRVVILAPELRALATGLYFGLTSLAGKQTLGQEYCGIDLIAADGGASGSSPPLSKASSRLYTFVRVVLPYLQERLREGWHGLWSLRDPLRGGGGGAVTAAAARARARARARAALAPPVGISVSSGASETEEVGVTELEEGQEEEGALSGVMVEDTPASGRDDQQTPLESRHRRLRRRAPPPFMASLARQQLHRLLSWARRRRPAVSGVLEWVLRLHLIAFYFDGRFGNMAMRVAGARLAYVRLNHEAPRTRYPVLGLLLLLQVAAEGAVASAETAGRWRAVAGSALLERLCGRPAATSGEARAEDSGVALDENQVVGALPRVPAIPPERSRADEALFPNSRRRCSLCMSNREKAAATRCGHLFCWECIVGWCQTNPECPLCRQPVSPQSIVCLYQYA